jgi:hypothetical protein
MLDLLAQQAGTALGNMSARLSQAVTDVGTDRTNLGTDLGSFATAISDVGTALGLADTQIDSAITYINSVNLGDNVSGNYSYLAKDAVDMATGHLAEARSCSVHRLSSGPALLF